MGHGTIPDLKNIIYRPNGAAKSKLILFDNMSFYSSGAKNEQYFDNLDWLICVASIEPIDDGKNYQFVKC